MYLKKKIDFSIQYIMAYKNLLQFLKIHHGLEDIGSAQDLFFRKKQEKPIGQPIANEEEMPQKS